MTRERTVLLPLRASIPLGASSDANRFVYGSGRGPYDPIISSSLSTVRKKEKKKGMKFLLLLSVSALYLPVTPARFTT